MDFQLVIQEKLHPGHKCICCILGSLIENRTESERFIALIEGEGDHGLFFYLKKSSDNLVLDAAFPITSDLRLYIDARNEETDNDDEVKVKINYEKNAFSFVLKLPQKNAAHVFLQDVKRCISVVEATEAYGRDPDFKWLEAYLQPQNPFLDEVDKATEGVNSKKDDWSHDIIFQKNVGENCPVVNISDGLTEIEELSDKDYRSAYSHKRQSMGPRDDKIKNIMRNHFNEYTDSRSVTVCCGTWNVNGQFPSEDCRPWLNISGDPPDIYCIGFQELDLSASVYVRSDTSREPEWEFRVRQGLHPKATYKKLDLVRLAGIMILVFVREELQQFVSCVTGSYVVTGLLGMLGNKGGVAVRFELYDTSLCFINSHLAAHTEEFERRNQDFHNINSKMKFVVDDNQLSISDHDVIFWIGDLNYRFHEIDIESAKMLIDRKDYAALFKFDQLRWQKRDKRIFLDYKEGEIKFPPTYKYDPGTDIWDTSEKCRTPAWCDRILWKGTTITQTSYESIQDLKISDHKPVRSLFTVQLKEINGELYDKTYEDIMKMLDKTENLYLPQVSLSVSELNFNDLKFVESRGEIISITNSGQVPVLFEFKNNEHTRRYCKPWIILDPISGYINVGESCNVQVEVYIDKDTAPNLNCGKDEIDDILILHLKEGKDFFITVNGSYNPSIFGSSIEALVQMFKPIGDYIASEITDFENVKAIHPLSSEDDRPFDIPKELWRLIDHLNRHGLHQENLFQHPGMHSEIQQIRDCLDHGFPSNIPGSIHSIAESLLLLLEAFAEPIIPYIYHSKCIDAHNNFLLCKQMLRLIPTSHHNIFKYVCAFLRKLLVYSSKNNLKRDTLAAQFGSLFLRSPKELNMSKQQSKIRETKKAAFVYHFLCHDYK